METKATKQRVPKRVWPVILFAVVAALVATSLLMFNRSLISYVPVTLTSDRSGLQMESRAKVKLRGVEVGLVDAIHAGTDTASLKLNIFPGQVKYIPANVQARIQATTVFGAKYVELIYPSKPSPKRLSAGQVIVSQNVATEVNTVFQNLTNILHEIEPAKLNGVLTALADGLRGQGPRMGEAITAADQVLLQVNSRAETIRQDWRAQRDFSDTYSGAAQNILAVLNSLSTTSTTITTDAAALDSLLANVIGLSRSGIGLLGPAKDNFISSINALEPTTSLLLKYNPEVTCTIVGTKLLLDRQYEWVGGNGRTAELDSGLLFGADAYRYPDNLPIIGAKGGPGGKPGCGSLPDVSKNFPVRQLVTDTGWGTGLDWRPNPGIGFPGYADYLPVTRGHPEPPSVRHPGPPAPGPPDVPPYGAPLYAPDGTPLYPGLPPAPPSGAPPEAGAPPPGSEPFVVPAPAQVQPTHAFQPPPPPPEQAAPSP